MRSRASSGIPAPRSSPSISTSAPGGGAESRTSLSGGEYFTAFETRLARMRSSASGSASTGGSADAQSTTSVSTAPRRNRLAVAASAASTATGVRWSVGARPRSRRERSRSEEHTSELQSRPHLVCRLLLEKKKKKNVDVTILKCYKV